jgi:hypothetical protein
MPVSIKLNLFDVSCLKLLGYLGCLLLPALLLGLKASSIAR